MSDTEHGFEVQFRFPVCFTRGAWHPANSALVDAIRRREPGRRHRALVVVDDHVARAQPALLGQIREYCAAYDQFLELVADPVLVPGGETAKNGFGHALTLLEKISEARIDRQSFIVVIGGGAVLDMVSFAAAIAHRGIRIIRFPTTVLAQGDSGIAVKNGINLFGKKNFIGSFVPAFAVINDVLALETLSPRDKIAGLSEAVKVALLKDVDFFHFLEQHADRIASDVELLAQVVRRSAELHLAHICGNGDPFELGSARPLDFGHWAAHKLESMTAYRIRHGEAVAIGMALDLTYSVALGFLDGVSMERVFNVLEGMGLRLWDDALAEHDPNGEYTLIKGLEEFREHLGGQLHITLLRAVGSSFEVTEMDEAVVAASIESLRHRATRSLVEKPPSSRAAAVTR